MLKTQHLHQRMNHRGIDSSTIRFTIEFGEIEGDRYVINHKNAKKQVMSIKAKVRKLERLHKKFKSFQVVKLIAKKLLQLKSDFAVAKRICDKKGVVVVCVGEAIITTYNKSSYLSY